MARSHPIHHPIFPAWPPERETTDLDGAKVAVMITAFRIGPILTDTILSALDQVHVSPVAVLLVVDGCPEVETTRAISDRFLAAYPGLFQTLWLENGGVSRARNQGLKWLLDRYPDLDAIYCLDGDDLISRTAIASSLLALHTARASDPGRKFGWAFDNKLHFGDDHTYIETSERFRPTAYLAANLSQPSCLYAADMFREGILWDEDMRTGIEDWEYWLAAIEAGWEGVYNPRDLLYYRRLMGNRSSVNRMNDSYNIPYMHKKHAGLLTPRAVLADEQANTPRYAFGLPGDPAFQITTDPALPGQTLEVAEVINALGGRLQRAAPGAYIYDPYAPDILCLIAPEQREILAREGLLRGLLMAAETYFSQGVGVVECVAETLRPSQIEVAGRDSCFIFAKASPAETDLAPSTARGFFIVRLSRICRAGGGGRVSPGELYGKSARLLIRTGAAPALNAQKVDYGAVAALATRLNAHDAYRAESRVGTAQQRGKRFYVTATQISNHAQLTKAALGTLSLFPVANCPDLTRVAVILPPGGLAGRAGLAVQQIADRLGERGRISLFAPDHRLPGVPPRLKGRIEDLVSLSPWTRQVSTDPHSHSLGVPDWFNMNGTFVSLMAGLFAPYDCVLSFALNVFAPVLLRLKALGVHTVALEADAEAAAPHALMTPFNAKIANLPDDPVAALPLASAVHRIVCNSDSRASAIASVGFPLNRIDTTLGPLLDHLDGIAMARQPCEKAAE